jgi:hypothetical protein
MAPSKPSDQRKNKVSPTIKKAVPRGRALSKDEKSFASQIAAELIAARSKGQTKEMRVSSLQDAFKEKFPSNSLGAGVARTLLVVKRDPKLSVAAKEIVSGRKEKHAAKTIAANASAAAEKLQQAGKVKALEDIRELRGRAEAALLHTVFSLNDSEMHEARLMFVSLNSGIDSLLAFQSETEVRAAVVDASNLCNELAELCAECAWAGAHFASQRSDLQADLQTPRERSSLDDHVRPGPKPGAARVGRAASDTHKIKGGIHGIRTACRNRMLGFTKCGARLYAGLVEKMRRKEEERPAPPPVAISAAEAEHISVLDAAIAAARQKLVELCEQRKRACAPQAGPLVLILVVEKNAMSVSTNGEPDEALLEIVCSKYAPEAAVVKERSGYRLFKPLKAFTASS